MAELTARQKEVLDFIRQQLQENGYPPSSREIQARFGFQSQTAAMNHLRALERKGAIERTPGKARSAVDPEVVRARMSLRSIPLFGQIPAGMAVESSQLAEGALNVDPSTFGVKNGKNLFALRVRGDSMIDAQIADGDTVVLINRPPRNGDIVAALIDGESTLKRYAVEKGKPYLKAENRNYPDLVPASDLMIQGVMVGLLRTRVRGS